MVTSKYPGRQAELYLAAKIGWSNFLVYIVLFTAFKAFYDNAFYAAQIAQITTARQMPDVNVRNSKVSAKRLATSKKAKVVRNLFQSLKKYIDSAFQPDEALIKYKEAGIAHYSEASNENWDATENLISDASLFITENLAVLTANNNMPPTFQTDFDNAANKFTDALGLFYAEEVKEKKITEDKITASNLIYEQLSRMFSDAQEIFRDDEALRSTFTVEYVFGLVTQKIANITGNISTQSPSESLDGFEIRILETDDFVLSDNVGHFNFGAVAAGTYTLQVSKLDYTTQTIKDVEVQTGTTKKINITMVKA